MGQFLKVIYKFTFIFFFVFSLLQGCATVKGPEVSSLEEEKAQREILVRFLQNWVKDVQRTTAITYNLRKAIPSKDNFGFSGIISIPLKGMKPEYLSGWEALTNRSLPKAGYLLLPVPGGPAERGGIKLYDIALEAPPEKVRPNENIVVRLVDRTVEFQTEKIGVKVNKIKVIPAAEVNAFVDDSNNLYLTNSLLRFVNDDNQLAVIIGHELAHIERGHVVKRMGVGVLVGILAAAAEAIITSGQGSGDLSWLITQAVVSKFSRDQEREADYFGLKYAYLAGYDIEKGVDVWLDLGSSAPASLTKSFLSTHPTSSERLARLRKIVSLLKDGKTWDEFEAK